MAVPQRLPHILSRGDSMTEQKYDATYRFGKTVVHVVSPGELSQEEFDKRLKAYQRAGWSAWNSLTTDQKLSLNEAAASSEDSL
ncbi:hypothetical protein [Bacillus solitudinis]|uniref:hypothetical protein n=1 Tax=Bacillus solitudinis TaxID=2014074 RepID=UPI000C247A90|nr:hypothetical protein [Bacillus solitudinis]